MEAMSAIPNLDILLWQLFPADATKDIYLGGKLWFLIFWFIKEPKPSDEVSDWLDQSHFVYN